jgi:two-component system, chemotaxis family, sensor kinase CheA
MSQPLTGMERVGSGGSVESVESKGGKCAGLRSVEQQIDELCTRLLIGGVGKLAGVDFEGLARAAAADGLAEVAAAAARLGKQLAAEAEAPAKLREELLTRGLEQMRAILERPAENPVQAQAPAQSSLNAFAADPEMIAEFITESREHLVAIVDNLLQLEQDNLSVEVIHAIFRGFHTIKGLAGFLELGAIQEVAHEVETLLDLARTSQLTITPPVVDVVLESTDSLRQQIGWLEQALRGGPAATTASNVGLLARIRAASKPGMATVVPPGVQPPETIPDLASSEMPMAREGPVAARVWVERRADREQLDASGEKRTGAPAIDPTEVVTPGPAREERRASDTSSVRIETEKLDHLMNMVGELVIAQTLISHNPSLGEIKDSRLAGDLNQLTRITADVQRITTSMRMVPIGLQFQKTARLVRDLARKVGKQIVLVTSGEDTELDKTIAEQLSDPLLHMVRNSIDHGIETPDQRIRMGKDSTARIRLAAYHRSGQIVIEIVDDGRGLDREKILSKATERGLVKPGEQLSDNEIFLLIFEAGFSTAEKLTDISGRGVGIDVVRKHVQKMRGRIDIQSEAGRGTTFFLKLPLTLAIIEGLVVVVGEHRYILPVFAVTEMFRPEPAVLSTVQGKGEMAIVRGRLLPVVRLHARFELEPRSRELSEGMLVVVESEGKRFCLFVDDLIGKQEVVIKGLGETFKDVAGLAGCAILGDGRVGLILDIDGIYQGRS